MNRRHSCLATVIALGCLLSSARPALAEPPVVEPPVNSAQAAADAKRLFTEGQAAFQRNDLPAAEQAFEASYRLSPTYDTATNLGMVEMKQGKWREAAEHLDVALRGFPVSESADRRQKVEAMLVECKLKVVTLRIKVNVSGAKVLVNGQEVGVAPLSGDVYVEPGPATVACSLPGYEGETKNVQGTSRTAQELSFDLKKKEGGDKPIWPAIVLGIAGAGGIGAGIGLIVAAKTGTSGFEDTTCPGGAETCPEDVKDAASQHNLFIGLGSGFMVLGALAFGGMGLYLGLPGDSDDKAAAFQLIPSASPDNAGLLLRGRW